MAPSPALLSQSLTGWFMVQSLGSSRDPEALAFQLHLCSDPVRVASGGDLQQALGAHLPELPRLRAEEDQATDAVGFILIGVREKAGKPGLMERFDRTFLMGEGDDTRDWDVATLDGLVADYAAYLANHETAPCHIEAVVVHAFAIDEAALPSHVRFLDRMTTGAFQLALDEQDSYVLPSLAARGTLEVTAVKGAWVVTAFTVLSQEHHLLSALPLAGEGRLAVAAALVTPVGGDDREQEGDDEILNAMLSGDPDVQIPPGWRQRR